MIIDHDYDDDHDYHDDDHDDYDDDDDYDVDDYDDNDDDLYIIGALCLSVCLSVTKVIISVFKRFCRFSCLQLRSVLKGIGSFHVS